MAYAEEAFRVEAARILSVAEALRAEIAASNGAGAAVFSRRIAELEAAGNAALRKAQNVEGLPGRPVYEASRTSLLETMRALHAALDDARRRSVP